MANIYRKSISLIFISIICQAINLMRDILLAKSYGASSINDVYLASQTIVSVITTMINSPMATAYIPIASKYYFDNDYKQHKDEYISIIYSDVLIISLILTTIELLLVNSIASIAAPGFTNEYKYLLIRLILVQSPITFINIIKGVNRGNLQILQRFKLSEITAVFPYFALCIYLLMSCKKDVVTIASLLSITTCLSIIPEIIILKKEGIRFKFSPGVNSEVKALLKIMSAAALTSGIREINVLFDKSISSLLTEGSITMLSYSSKLTVVVVGLISASVSLVGFAKIARLSAQKRKKDILKNVTVSCNLINLFIIPISIYLMMFSEDIIKILYFNGSFTMSNVKETALLMRLYSIGLIGYGFQDVFTRTLHAHKIVKCTLKASILMVCINVILNLILYKQIGAKGVAIATSISILCVIPVLASDTVKHIGRYDVKKIVCEMIHMMSVSAGVACITNVVKKCIYDFNQISSFLICSFIYICLYVLLSYMTNNDTFRLLITNLKGDK